jgi:RNA polymerase sigma-70 factor (ECF subfamily)
LSAYSNSFDKIALPYLDTVYRAAFAITGSKDTAEDLTQAAFLKALKSFNSFQPGTNCKAWLLTILRNTWYDQLRHKKVAGPTTPIDELEIAEKTHQPQTAWTDANDLIDNFSDEQIIAALCQLPDDQRLTLYLTDVEQLSQKEVAEITGVAEGTVKSRTSRARAQLKIKLDAYAKQMGLTGDTK